MVKNQLPVSGHPVYTSIDIDLQLAGEEAFGDQEGALVALDVNTGEVLALVSEPAYDLNDTTPFISNDVWADINKREALMNRAIQGLYPPGSTFKIITAMAALRAGVLTPDRVINCPGYIMIGNRRLNCDNHSGHGPIKFVEAMRESCNVFFATLGLEVGVDKLAAEAKRFGLDHPTGIELPGEARGMIVPSPEWKKKRDLGPWVDGDTGNMSIGQGFDLFTPLQMACFMASFARNETATVPTILRRNSPGLATSADNREIELSATDRALIIEGMEQAAKTGTAKLASVPGVRLAAKTGTAEKDVWDKGRKRNMDVAWLTVFGPVERPTIAIAVAVAGDPGKSTWGSQAAAPIAQKVLAKYFAKHPPPKPPAPIVAGDVNAPR
jgi:penicillin-binding protein 2